MQPGVKASLGIATLITGQRAAGGAGAAAGADELLTGQSNIKLRMLGGNDFLEVTG